MNSQNSDLELDTKDEQFSQYCQDSMFLISKIKISMLAFVKENIAYGDKSGSIHLMNPITGLQVGKELKGHSKMITSLDYSLEQNLLASGSEDMTLRLWNLDTYSSFSDVLISSDVINNVCFSRNGQFIVSSSIDSVSIWNYQTRIIQIHYSLRCIDYQTNLLISGGKDYQIRIWNGFTGKEITRTFPGHKQSSYIQCIKVFREQIIASGSFDNIIRIRDLQTRKQLRCLSGHVFYITALAFSANGQTLMSGSGDCSIIQWDILTATKFILKGHFQPINSIGFSSDGSHIISSDSDTIRVQNIE